MFYLYILYSSKYKRLYVGQTENLEKRVKEHNEGKARSTKKFVPFLLIYSETFTTRGEAMKREKFLKSLYGANFKRKVLKEFLVKT